MNIKEQIENYKPFNREEQMYKRKILKYLKLFEDVLTRKNEIAHFTSSGFVLNESRDKVLMVYHNIYNSWAYPGGHADGNSNFLEVALREVEEETGVKNIIAISEEIFGLDILSCPEHIKRGIYVPAHLHLSIEYILEASEREMLKIKQDENSNVSWLPLETFLDEVTEEEMKPVYAKIVEKARKLKYI